MLLKNASSILPLNAKSLRTVALFGSKTLAGAAKLPKTGPGGILMVNAPYTVSPLEGLQNTLKTLASSASVTYNEGTDLAAAATLAAKADVAIVMVGDNSVEAEDRANLSLPKRDGVEQEALIVAIAAANPRTIVVLKNGGPVLMPWLDKVPAVLEAWYPGQEDGNAVANLLFGVANPSGKLPLTFPRVEREAAAATEAQFPGAMVDGKREARYTEGLEIGYRWYDAHKATPLFPFGFGLSYTTFALSNLKVTAGSSDGTKPIQVQVRVKNIGKVYGAEVPQVYLHLPSSPTAKRLVAFQKVWLKPNETKTVTLTIDPAASNHPLSSWDTAKQAWTMSSGEYKVSVGNSATNLLLSGSIKVRATSSPR